MKINSLKLLLIFMLIFTILFISIQVDIAQQASEYPTDYWDVKWYRYNPDSKELDTSQCLGEDKWLEININKNWGEGVVYGGFKDRIGFIARREIQLESGQYTFIIGGDDGFRLYIDVNEITNDWKTLSFRYQSYSMNLNMGSHIFEIQWFENEGDARVEFSIIRSSVAIENVNTFWAIFRVESLEHDVKEDEKIVQIDGQLYYYKNFSNNECNVTFHDGSSVKIFEIVSSTEEGKRYYFKEWIKDNQMNKESSFKLNALDLSKTITIRFIKQWYVSFTYEIIGDGSPQPPPLKIDGESKEWSDHSWKGWVNDGSRWEISNPLIRSSNIQRWYSNNNTQGKINSRDSITIKYYNQYHLTLFYSIKGNSIGHSPPTFTAKNFTISTPVRLTEGEKSYWFDYGSEWSINDQLEGSNSTRRWKLYNASSGVINSNKFSFIYYEQCYLNFSTKPESIKLDSKISNQWYNSSESIKIRPEKGILDNKLLLYTGKLTNFLVAPKILIEKDGLYLFYGWKLDNERLNDEEYVNMNSAHNLTATYRCISWFYILIPIISFLLLAYIWNRRSRRYEELTVIKYPEGNIGLASDIGGRKVNEDSLAALKAEVSFMSKISRRFLLMVADGMGGHNKGELASSMCIKEVAKFMAPYLLNQHDEGGRTLIEAIETANERIYEISKRSEATRGMGTTITAAFIKDYQAYIANVGDSRTYLIRRNKIYRVTKDHSLVQEMIDKGKLTEEQAHHHPNRNVITRVVGYKEKIMVDIFNLELQSGDSLLLCTDGLHSRVMDYEMLTIVNRYHDPNKACHELVKLAKKRMASDNISVILIRL